MPNKIYTDTENDPNGFTDIPGGWKHRYQVDRAGNFRKLLPDGRYVKLRPGWRAFRSTGAVYSIGLMQTNGKFKVRAVPYFMAITFLGGVPEGCIAYNIDSCKSNCVLSNIGISQISNLISQTNKGKRKSVLKISSTDGSVLDIYPSIKEAGKENNYDPSTVAHICQGRIKGDEIRGFTFRYEEATKWELSRLEKIKTISTVGRT